MTLRPLAAMALVLVILGAILGALRLWQLRYSPHPELARKLLHVAMGLITLSFPWLFDSVWPVVTLALLAVGAMLALRHVGALRASVGGVVHAVGRESSGEIYFPVAVAALFYLSHGVTVLYTIPILLLTLADAVAALIGVRYGLVKFDTFEGGRKSLEGAVAFFAVAFLCTHITLLLSSHVGRVETLLIGLETGFLVMLVELVAWRGLDNLFIPLFSFALLYNIEYLQTYELFNRLFALSLVSAFVALWRKRTTLDFGALIAALLIAYVIWTIGGLRWLAPPAVCFATYALLWPQERLQRGQTHDLRSVLSFSAVGVFWLYVSTRYPQHDWSYLSVVAFAVQVAVIGYASGAALARCLLVGWIVPFIPYVALRGIDATTLQLALAALPLVAVGLGFFALGWRRVSRTPYSMQRWLLQGGASAVGSLGALVPWILLRG
jgi:phytol kinase